MKKLFLLMAGMALAMAAPAPDQRAADRLGWRLAVHSYSFRKFTIFDAIDQTAALGVKYMSISGHVILAGSNSITTVALPDADMQAIRAKMLADGIHWPFVNIGVVELPADEAKSRKVFEFAKKWSIGTLVAEPPADALDTVAKLCQEYNIRVAIHDHARPTHYWNPDTVLAAVKDRTPLMGDCADIGHWIESGLDPVACLKKLQGRIICLHFKDNNISGLKGHNVPWGTGAGKSREIMEELQRQHFQGDFCIEYEYHPDNPGPEIAQCVNFFNTNCTELAALPAK